VESKDYYSDVSSLLRAEREGTAFQVTVRKGLSSRTLVIAPHGGCIEPGTEQLAAAVAARDFNLYVFRAKYGATKLHVSSHRFHEPRCMELLAEATTVVALHGCKGRNSRIYIGGRDLALRKLLAHELRKAGYLVHLHDHAFPGTHKRNVCNMGRSGRGAQLELTRDLRTARHRDAIAKAVQKAIRLHNRESFKPDLGARSGPLKIGRIGDS
jgi:phage replication-related protein YjqB (UPF0714/DUF867 family)